MAKSYNQPSRAKYKNYGIRSRNKERRQMHELCRLGFFKLRNQLMKAEGLSKGNARRRIRQMQKDGEVDKSLSPLKRSKSFRIKKQIWKSNLET